MAKQVARLRRRKIHPKHIVGGRSVMLEQTETGLIVISTNDATGYFGDQSTIVISVDRIISILDGGVDSDQLAAGAVIASKIGSNQVQATHILAGSIVESKLGTGAVTNAKLGSGAVTNAKIADGAVSAAKLDETGADEGDAFVHDGDDFGLERVNTDQRMQVLPWREVTANTNLTTDDYRLVVTTGSINISLPNPADCEGAEFIIQDQSADFGGNPVTLVRNGTENINDGAANKTLSRNPNTVYQIFCNGTDWWVHYYEIV